MTVTAWIFAVLAALGILTCTAYQIVNQKLREENQRLRGQLDGMVDVLAALRTTMTERTDR